MKIFVHHKTIYNYEASTRRSIQLIRMTPQTLSYQSVNAWTLTVPRIGSEVYDGFGNYCTMISINEPHQQLEVTADGEIDIDEKAESIEDNRNPVGLFLTKTPLTACSEAMLDFATPFLDGDISRTKLIDFSHALLDRVSYEPGTTDVLTSAPKAFDLGRGVCQDHTHLFLACARHFNIPARYVSGYLHTDSEDHSATHAWAEAFIDNRWYVFDTSNRLFSPSQHVQIAIGLDYNDTAPIRGVRVGGGSEKMNYAVRVMNEQQQQSVITE